MARGRAGTQMSGLPREHARGPGGGALCGAKRRWGVLTTQRPEDTNCKKCQDLLRAATSPTHVGTTPRGSQQ